KGIIFLLWGGFAQKKGSKIDASKHHVLTCGHPSPLSANKGHCFGNKHFSETNRLLQQMGKTPINWKID
ncbi:MAG TPA: uracil-DNA glycosylase, partial [Vicingus sp.]|nr:uracil-DNA glycosylase [Vicingus sp.]